jgi:cysteine desulfuration protein SufE
VSGSVPGVWWIDRVIAGGLVKLDELLADFEGAEPEEALEQLIDLSENLPPVSEAHGKLGRPAECRIQECQTPVFLWVDVADGKVHLEADVPEKSPTVRGFVALLVVGLEGASPAEVLNIPDDFLPRLGLAETLGMTRQRGFRGIVSRIKREAANADRTH